MSPRRARWRRRFKLACLALSLAVGLPLLGEFALRAHVRWRFSSSKRFQDYSKPYLRWIEDSKLTLWENGNRSYRPGAVLASKELGLDVRINSRGYRTPEFSLTPAPGTYRIVVLGGSTTVGGATNASTWPAQLGRRLNQRKLAPGHERIEVINMGVSGAELSVARWRLTTEVEQYRPAAVVLYHGVNCIKLRRPLILGRYPRLGLALKDSELLDVLTRSRRDSRLFLRTCAAQFSELQAIVSWCQARKLPLFVCTFAIPRREDFDAETWEFFSLHSRVFWVGRDMDAYTWSLQHWNRFLRLWAAEKGTFRLLDIEPKLKGTFFKDPCHLTDAGLELQSQLVAEQLTPHLERLGVLAEKP